MKKAFTTLLCLSVISSYAQFITQSLNYPDPNLWPVRISIADRNHVWLGSVSGMNDPYPVAVHSVDGGSTWIFDSIPASGHPIFESAEALDSNRCSYVFYDGMAGTPSIWRTSDQGNSWINLSGSQFSDEFIDFIHFFSSDTCLTVSDPIGGYFEIHRSFDGGINWDQVPTSDMPHSLPGEYGFGAGYSSIGNTIWFSTSKGRCFRSIDKGMSWTVTQVASSTNKTFMVCFSSDSNGVFWGADNNSTDFEITIDGGITWQPINIMPGVMITDISRVKGFEKGFVVSVTSSQTSVYFTSDLFNTTQLLDHDLVSTGALEFYDANTGWLTGSKSATGMIFKFAGVLSSEGEDLLNSGRGISIMPNPASNFAKIQLPKNLIGNHIEISIYSTSGVLVSTNSKVMDSEWLDLDPARYQNGIYYVEVVSKNNFRSLCRWIVMH